MGYRVLILIDHTSHNITNSVYQLARMFSRHEKVDKVFVASRANPANSDFFDKLDASAISVVPVDPNFAYDKSGSQFMQLGPHLSLSDIDLLIMRLPHPISMEFFSYLESNFSTDSIINRPQGILRTGSKQFLLELKELCPPIRWCRTYQEILDFHQQYNLILKPLRNYGGKGILRIYNSEVEDQNGRIGPLNEVQNYLKDLRGDGYLAMQYMENVHQGDKRIVVVNGKIVGAALRKPAPGSWLCNVSQGGHAEAAVADAREEEIAAEIHRTVGPMGIGIFGMDTLVNESEERVLSEINTLSVGGFGPMEIQHQKPITSVVADELINYFEHTRK